MADLNNGQQSAIAELQSMFGESPTETSTESETANDEIEDSGDENSESHDEIDEAPEKVVEDGDDNEDNSDDAEVAESEAKVDTEVITAAGKKITIDYQDRDKIKKAYSMAAGMRQAFAERDKLQASHKELEAKYSELKESWDILEGAKNDDTKLFNLITGRDLEEMIANRIEEANLLSKMSPEQLEAYSSKKELEQAKRELELSRQQMQEEREAIQAQKDASEKSKQQSLVYPAFDKYRYAGTTGNAKAESAADRMLWERAYGELQEIEDVTPEIIQDTFRRVRDDLDTFINLRADNRLKETKKTTTNKATKKAQKAAVRSRATEEPNELVNALSGFLARR